MSLGERLDFSARSSSILEVPRQRRVVARRFSRCRMEQATPDSTKRFGVFELDLRSGELRKAGTRIRLQDQPLKILIALLEQPGAVVTREDLKRRIWPEDSFGDFDHAVNVAVAKLRAALADSADTPRYVETLPRRGYRFIFPVTLPASFPAMFPAAPAPTIEAPHANGRVITAPPAPPLPVEPKAKFKWLPMAAAGMLVLALGASAWWWFHSRKLGRMLTSKDTVVLADFQNTTGDAVFDGTIRQGLAVQLEQSPFLSLVSDVTVRQTLRLMNQPPDARLTPDLAQQVCLRTGSTAVLNGSIAKLGNQYVLGMKAINCGTGDSLVEEQVTAAGKEEVLKALAQAASRLRSKLGESLGTVQRYNTPLEQVTTSSLQALHAYSLGRTTLIDREDRGGAIQLFQRAIQLDPNFAMAYASLGLAYANDSEEESVRNFTKAYELRERVSDRERFYIESHYHSAVTGDWDKAWQVYKLWSQLYPRDDIPHLNIGEIDSGFGEYENARMESAESLRLLPGDCISYGHLLGSLIHLDRWDEARALMNSAEKQQAGCQRLQDYRYILGFLKNDKAEMAQAVTSSPDQSDIQFSFLQVQTAAYYGRLRESRELMRRVASSAWESDQEELGGFFAESNAESEALFGDAEFARKEAKEALSRSKGRDVEGLGAVALALAGDETDAQSLAGDLARRFPESTIVQTNYLPSVHAQLALNHHDAAKALDALQAAAPYELGDCDGSNVYVPIFLRGQAYLSAGRGKEAAAEFQKILDHRGVVLNSPVGALAPLQIARAFVLQGDNGKAVAAYGDFLTRWKDADAEIPILKQAKAEYAKLR
jgi:eukaryotic-like serine/threonine-protein kinase